jgi:predicted nuclease of predicted toxin-antitoxin system
LRILLDENVDRRLKADFAEGHDVVTVAEAGWVGKRNGELLRLAEKDFEVFVSTDKGIPHQQNVSRLDLAVVLLRARSTTPSRTWHC